MVYKKMSAMLRLRAYNHNFGQEPIKFDGLLFRLVTSLTLLGLFRVFRF